jgi:uncharacterized protein
MSILLFALALQLTPAQRVAWVPNPRVADGSWVSDASGRLQPATRDSLNRLITLLESETTAEIAVVVVDSLSGLDRQEFALAIHRLWGVGKAGKDNGIVFLWAPNDRDVYVSIGTGLEGVLPDRRTGRILDEFVIPEFRKENFDEGVVAGVAALAAAAREETLAPGSRWTGDSDDDGGIPGFLVALLGGVGTIGLGAGGFLQYRRYQRRKPRPCPKCGTMMVLLDEQADDAELEEGARVEEQIKSIDWDVWQCPSCSETLHLPYKRIFSGHEDCPQCRRRTVKVTQRLQITAPTTTSTGLAHVTRKCRHCSHAWTTSETIPRRTAASSGGSGGSRSGGSSFGGGSARGGGAGRSY